MITYAELEQELKAAIETVANVEKRMKEARAAMTFPCKCGKDHAFKDVICLHHYRRSGSEWSFSEYQLVCPDTDNKNRLLWSSRHLVDWTVRDHYVNNAEEQFGRLFEGMFKTTVKDYEGERDADKRGWWNNHYIDEHRLEYGIRIKVIDDNHQECRCAKCRKAVGS